jgi:hypothetical protein
MKAPVTPMSLKLKFFIFLLNLALSISFSQIPPDPQLNISGSNISSKDSPIHEKATQTGYLLLELPWCSSVFDMEKKQDKIYIASDYICELDLSKSDPSKNMYVVNYYVPSLIKGMRYNYVVAVEVDTRGTIWFGTYNFRSYPYSDGQLIKWDGNYNWEFFTTENSPLPANGIRSLKADEKGGIWIGTINGVCYFDGSNFITLDSLNSFLRGLPGDGKRIIDIEIDPKGNVWLGTWGGGVVKYDGKNITAYNKDGMMRFITGIEIDSRGNIFVSSFSEFDENTNQYTGGGLFIYDCSETNWCQIIPPISRNIWTITIDRNDILWASFFDWYHQNYLGVGYFDGNRWEFYNTSNSPLYLNAVSKIFIDENNKKFFGHYHYGLARKITTYDGSKWSHIKVSVPPAPYRKVVVDSQNRKWQYDDEGVAIIRPEVGRFNYTIFDSPIHLPFGIYSAPPAVDKNGTLWTALDSILICFDGENWKFLKFDTLGYYPHLVKTDRKNNKWIILSKKDTSSDCMLVKYDDREFKIILNLPYIPVFGFDTAGNPWFKLDDKLICASGEDGRILKEFEGIPGRILGIDKNNNIWLSPIRTTDSSLINTIVKFDGVEKKIYRFPRDASSCCIEEFAISFSEAPDGSIWFGTEVMGVVGRIIEFKSEQLIEFSRLPTIIFEISVDQERNIWFAGEEMASQFVYLRDTYVGVKDEPGKRFIAPSKFVLHQNYPNPFNPSTTIEFDIPEKTNVKLIIYDILGREVETIIDKELEPGKYKINFTATNLPSGVYFYTLKTPKFTKTNKMLLIK